MTLFTEFDHLLAVDDKNKTKLYKNTWHSFFFGMLTNDSFISVYVSCLWKFIPHQGINWWLYGVKILNVIV